MKLFSGTSNRPLAEKIASQLGISLGNVEITRFIDNECRVFVQEDVADEDVYVLQSLSEVADQNLVELCLLGAALKSMKAKMVTAVIPWMGYSKQDKAFRKGEAISSQLVAKFIEAAGFDAVITVELHSENVVPFFHISIVELSTHILLADTLSVQSRPGLENMIVVSPDKGGVSRSETFAKEHHLPILHITKFRDRKTGEVIVSGIDGDVSGKPVIIFDDIINTGQTAIKTSAFVKQKGAVSVYFLATHGVFAGDASRALQTSCIDKVVVTDTIEIPIEKQFNTLSIISISHELASKIITTGH